MEKTLNLYQKLLVIQTKINGLGKDKSTYNDKKIEKTINSIASAFDINLDLGTDEEEQPLYVVMRKK